MTLDRERHRFYIVTDKGLAMVGHDPERVEEWAIAIAVTSGRSVHVHDRLTELEKPVRRLTLDRGRDEEPPCVYCREKAPDEGFDRCFDCRTWRDEEWCEARGLDHASDEARDYARQP